MQTQPRVGQVRRRSLRDRPRSTQSAGAPLPTGPAPTRCSAESKSPSSPRSWRRDCGLFAERPVRVADPQSTPSGTVTHDFRAPGRAPAHRRAAPPQCSGSPRRSAVPGRSAPRLGRSPTRRRGPPHRPAWPRPSRHSVHYRSRQAEPAQPAPCSSAQPGIPPAQARSTSQPHRPIRPALMGWPPAPIGLPAVRRHHPHLFAIGQRVGRIGDHGLPRLQPAENLHRRYRNRVPGSRGQYARVGSDRQRRRAVRPAQGSARSPARSAPAPHSTHSDEPQCNCPAAVRRAVVHIHFSQQGPCGRVNRIRRPHQLAFEVRPGYCGRVRVAVPILRIGRIDLRNIDEDAKSLDRRDVEDLLASRNRSSCPAWWCFRPCVINWPMSRLRAVITPSNGASMRSNDCSSVQPAAHSPARRSPRFARLQQRHRVVRVLLRNCILPDQALVAIRRHLGQPALLCAVARSAFACASCWSSSGVSISASSSPLCTCAPISRYHAFT